MFCSKCGGVLEENDKFCEGCGIAANHKEEDSKGDSVEVDNIRKPRKKKIIIGISAIVFLLIFSVGTVLGIGYIKNIKEEKELQEVQMQELQDSQLQNMQAILTSSNNIEEYIIIETEKEDYNRLLKELEEAINDKDTARGKIITEEIEDLKSAFITNSKNIISDKILELEAVDMSSAFDIEKLMVQEYSKEIEQLLGVEKYVSAGDIIIQWELVSNLVKSGNDRELLISQVDVMEYPKVKLYLQIRDLATGKTVDITQFEKFSIMENTGENYKEQPILAAMQLNEKEHININLTADISGSMTEEFDNVKSVMKNFLNYIQFDVGDSASLITFDNNISIDVDFTSTKSKLVDAITNMQLGNMTALYDALYVAVSKTSMQKGAKCVIAFTDGYDNDSTRTVDEVILLAQTYKIPVFIIGIGYDVDSDVLSHIADSTGGFYKNVSSGVSMESIYNDIYRQQKELYLLEYETNQSIEDIKERKIYVTYEDEDMAMRNVTNFVPKELMKEPEDYQELVNQVAISNSEIEGEILRIRAIWNGDKEAMKNKQYKVSKWANGMTAYSDNGVIKMIEIQKGIDGISYSRTYNYFNGKLIFAYVESSDAHRLYFKNDKLFRWRYTIDANKRNNAVNHDNQGDSEEFRKWGGFALEEGYRVYSDAVLAVQ